MRNNESSVCFFLRMLLFFHYEYNLNVQINVDYLLDKVILPGIITVAVFSSFEIMIVCLMKAFIVLRKQFWGYFAPF